jgi:RNA polymerase sigma-70 factor (ECF subfamily)
LKDFDLLEELNTNPNRAMEFIIEQYTGLVYSIINSKVSSVGTAEDVKECVSDVFMDFYRQAKGIDLANSSIKGYLAVIAKHKGIDLYRRLAGTASRSVNLDETYEQVTDNKLNPEQEVIQKEQRNVLIKAIESLGEPDRDIFIRKYFLGQRTKEIAEALYLRDNTVDKKISRGLKKLRILLGGVIHEGTEENLLTK